MLALPAELTQAQAQACLGGLLPALRAQAGERVEVDAAALQRFDSAALAVLLACRREAMAVGKRVAVRAMPERLRTLATLYGVAELLPEAA